MAPRCSPCADPREGTPSTDQPGLQDPFSSLDPRRPVGEAVAEPLTVHRLSMARPRAGSRIAELFELVGLPASFSSRYPHETLWRPAAAGEHRAEPLPSSPS